MQKIMIIYHSGSGSTKNICKIVEKKVSKSHETKMIEVSQKFDYNELMEYDKLIFAFPTYHTKPSKSISDFVEKMPVFEKTVPAFVLTTNGLYSGNSLRMLIKSLEKKNIITQNYLFIRGPAKDGVLLFSSWMPLKFSYGRKTAKKIEKFVATITENDKISRKAKAPFLKWYVPVTNLIKPFGEKSYNKYKENLHILPDLCTNCNICVKNCTRSSWSEGEPTPQFNSENCGLCLNCVHNCPAKAIVFSKKMINKPRLGRKFTA